MKKTYVLIVVLITVLLTVGCAGTKAPPAASDGSPKASPATGDGAKTKAQLLIDWTPNTNHTGIYVAHQLGYYEEEGIDLTILPPGTEHPETIVAAGTVEFGIGNQENVTQARILGVPLVSLAAIIQHNTSGFASPKSANIQTPKDFAGKVYGSYGGEAERAIIKSLMEQDGASVDDVTFINMGQTEFFDAIRQNIDFVWAFYAWTGIEAELRNEEINMLYLNEFSDQLDYYTPVFITNETMINDKPEVVSAFMKATSRGYNYAIDHPEEAAELLLQAVPDLDRDLVVASQKWLSPQYKADAPRWGEQKAEVWQLYSDWMYDNQLIEKRLVVEEAYTNEFLPK